MKNLEELEQEFPHAFGWAGEINVIKHALVGNGFFKAPESPRITKRFLDQGNLDHFFQKMEQEQWPVTIHCDCGNIAIYLLLLLLLLLLLQVYIIYQETKTQ